MLSDQPETLSKSCYEIFKNYWGKPERAPYRSVVDVGYESYMTGDERCVSGDKHCVTGKSHTASTCNGGTSIAFPTKHGKPHTA